MKKINWKILIISFLAVILTAVLGSLFTSPNTNTEWYDSIRPSITPPNWVFPVVWNILFFLIALSLYLALVSSNKIQKNKVIIIFAINFILNILWSVLYFGLRNPSAALFELIFLWLSILSMLAITYRINKLSSYLLVPYLLWVTFAGVLNYLSIV